MTLGVYVVPDHEGKEFDVVFCDPRSRTSSSDLVHYAYAIAADRDARTRRGHFWQELQRMQAPEYLARNRQWIDRLRSGECYRPGELTLGDDTGPDANDQLATIVRLGALELLANVSSGRLAPTDKDPFPHQLALQQFARTLPTDKRRKLLIADEVGLGKTIEAGLIIRDVLLARGSIDDFCCLYLTSGGLVSDAAEKLRSVMAGAFEGRNLVDKIRSFREFGNGNTQGVFVGSMDAARKYVAQQRKGQLCMDRVAPNVLIIDECHHAASDELLGGRGPSHATTQTYKAAHQLMSGTFWTQSAPPELTLLMSATPFRSAVQFENLMRLLVDGTHVDPENRIDAYDHQVSARDLQMVLANDKVPTAVVWRRQDDPEVRAWSGAQLFPNLTVVRPHLEGDVRLSSPQEAYLDLINEVKRVVREVSRLHGHTFGGFATAQLEKKLTSSSIAGACWLFTWCVRRRSWPTLESFNQDASEGTVALRTLIIHISQRVARLIGGDTRHATVEFPSDDFEFTAAHLAQRGSVQQIYQYHQCLRDIEEEARFELEDADVSRLCALAERLLGDDNGEAESAKLEWLNEMLAQHNREKFLVFTESLQTCALVTARFGSRCRALVGSMGEGPRTKAVHDFRTNPNVRLLIATSAADEGFDLQVANKVVHWDLSSSPATLMQRNGRVARLGQRSNVTSYYLILAGTHEERRDRRLRDTFAGLGITDEAMRDRILGTLSPEQLDELEHAIDLEDGALLGQLLDRAREDNTRMDQQLREIRTELQHTSVLDRADLADRLVVWDKLGLPETKITYEVTEFTWSMPNFADPEQNIVSCALEATVRNGDGPAEQRLVFDPEVLVFGEENQPRALAGLRPWAKRTGGDRVKIRPDARVDWLGQLLCTLVRGRGDFTMAARENLSQAAQSPDPMGDRIDWTRARWLLFCTHPVREAETTERGNGCHLTFYAFEELDGQPVLLRRGDEHAEVPRCAASASETHAAIKALEQQAMSRLVRPLNEHELTQARRAARAFGQWVRSVTRFGAAEFLGTEEYFVPIPVALIQLIG